LVFSPDEVVLGKSVSAGFDADRVRFVLVEPLAGGNVGSAARALKNLGFARLALVRPRCDPRGQDARIMAVDAADVVDAAAVYDDVDAALLGARTVVATTRRTGKHRRPHARLDLFAGELAALAAAGSVAVVFGREDHGLTDEELDRCTHLVHLPGSAAYGSFNLAQAVLLVAWELRRAALAGEPASAIEAPATHAEREAMLRHLQQALETIGFLHRDAIVPIMRRLRRMFGRALMTPEEVQLLRGMARQMLWCAERAGLPRTAEPDAAALDGSPEGREA
jgi:tRNA/rRNA methyltransferase